MAKTKIYRLDIEFKRLRQPHNENVYGLYRNGLTRNSGLVEIDTRWPIAKQIGTLFHEFMHFVCAIYFPNVQDDREHRLCEAVDTAAQRAVRKEVEGK